MVTILLDDAIKYTPESGSISIALEANDDTIQLVVKDTGIGVPAESRAEELRQVLSCQSGMEPGRDGSDGPGLFIAKWIVLKYTSPWSQAQERNTERISS